MMNGWLPVYGQPAFFVLMVSLTGYILRSNRNIPDNLRGGEPDEDNPGKKILLGKNQMGRKSSHSKMEIWLKRGFMKVGIWLKNGNICSK